MGMRCVVCVCVCVCVCVFMCVCVCVCVHVHVVCVWGGGYGVGVWWMCSMYIYDVYVLDVSIFCGFAHTTYLT